MLVWRGWGILVALLPITCSLIAELVFDHQYGAGAYRVASWPMPLALALSALPVYWVGDRLHRQPGRAVIDVETQARLTLKPEHTFFWIPMRYWSVVIVGVAGWMYAANTGLIYVH